MVQEAMEELRGQGYKVTRSRRLVMEVLDKVDKPLSPYDIQRLLQQQGEALNHVTIYRTLDLLCRLNLAHRVLLSGGFIRCALSPQGGCHRFMVCRGCGSIREFIDDALCHEESGITRTLGFHTEHHYSESLGLCSDCYRKQLEEDSTYNRM